MAGIWHHVCLLYVRENSIHLELTMKKTLSAVAAVVALGLGSAAQAAAFQNGGFEADNIGGSSYQTLSSLTGWTVSGGTVDLIGSYWSPHSGSQSLDLFGNSAASISQTFATVSGQAYLVTYFYSANKDGAGTVDLTATAEGQSNNHTIPFSPSMTWTQGSLMFQATGTSSTLTFSSNSSGAYGPALDTISVTAVPEPHEWALLLSGLGITGWVARRRRAKLA